MGWLERLGLKRREQRRRQRAEARSMATAEAAARRLVATLVPEEAPASPRSATSRAAATTFATVDRLAAETHEPPPPLPHVKPAALAEGAAPIAAPVTASVPAAPAPPPAAAAAPPTPPLVAIDPREAARLRQLAEAGAAPMVELPQRRLVGWVILRRAEDPIADIEAAIARLGWLDRQRGQPLMLMPVHPDTLHDLRLSDELRGLGSIPRRLRLIVPPGTGRLPARLISMGVRLAWFDWPSFAIEPSVARAAGVALLGWPAERLAHLASHEGAAERFQLLHQHLSAHAIDTVATGIGDEATMRTLIDMAPAFGVGALFATARL